MSKVAASAWNEVREALTRAMLTPRLPRAHQHAMLKLFDFTSVAEQISNEPDTRRQNDEEAP